MTPASLRRRLAALENSTGFADEERRLAIAVAAINRRAEEVLASANGYDPDPEFEAALRAWLASEESKASDTVTVTNRWVAETLLKAEEDMRSTSPKVVDHER